MTKHSNKGRSHACIFYFGSVSLGNVPDALFVKVEPRRRNARVAQSARHTIGSTLILTLGFVVTRIIRAANLSVDKLSSTFLSCAVLVVLYQQNNKCENSEQKFLSRHIRQIFAISRVLQLPPSESRNKFVNFDERKGI